MGTRYEQCGWFSVCAVLMQAIGSLAVSVTGEQLLTGCSDGKLKVWSTCSWDRVGVMGSKTRYIGRMKPCYLFFVSGGSDGMLKVWDRLKVEPVASYVAHLGCETAGTKP